MKTSLKYLKYSQIKNNSEKGVSWKMKDMFW